MAVESTKGDLANIVRIYWSLLLGNVVEWYEFAVYGYVEKQLEEHFFRGSAIATWLGFGVTFLTRPIGGTVFGIVADVFGRSQAVNITLIGMLIGTCGQGLLPTYANGEVAGTIGVILLILLRLLQGMCAAGEISTISTYLAEVGRRESLGQCISLIAVTINIGFLAAKIVVFGIDKILGHAASEAWGWRLAFLSSLVPGLIAIWGRRYVPESEAYLEEKRNAAEAAGPESSTRSLEVGEEGGEGGARKVVARPGHTRPSVGQVLQQHGGNILIGMGAVASFATLQYGGFVWLNSYLAKRGMTPNGTMLATLASRVVMILLNVPVGWLTDKKGVAWVTFMGSIMIAVFSVPLFWLVSNHAKDTLVVTLAIGLGFGTIGAMAGSTFFFYVVELFPTAVRGTAVGISFNIGFCIFGGLSPVIAQASLASSPLGPGIMLACGGLVTVLTLLCAQCLQRHGRVQLTHVRHTPYFASQILCAGDRDVKGRNAKDADGASMENDSTERGAPKATE